MVLVEAVFLLVQIPHLHGHAISLVRYCNCIAVL